MSFVSAGSFFAFSPVSFSLGFDEHSASSALKLFWSMLDSIMAGLSVECFVVDFVFG